MKTIDQLLGSGARYCYYLNELEPSPDYPDRFRVSMVFEREPGHYPTGGDDTEPWYWTKETCRIRNEKRLGLLEREVTKIIASSMFPNCTGC